MIKIELIKSTKKILVKFTEIKINKEIYIMIQDFISI